MDKLRFSKLRGRIRAMNYTEADVATMIHMARCTFSDKLNGKREFTCKEIEALCVALEITPEEKWLYF